MGNVSTHVTEHFHIIPPVDYFICYSTIEIKKKKTLMS
jgi:hypothetical protein